MLFDVVSEVVDQVCIWVVRNYDLICSIERAYQARKACASPKLEDVLVLNERFSVGLQIDRQNSTSIPEEVALEFAVSG